MNIKTLNRLFVLITAACMLFSLFCPAYSNWSPIVYVVLCIPYLVVKSITVTDNASRYIERYHPEFHKAHCAMPLTGHVRLGLIPDSILLTLKDDKIMAYKAELTVYGKLLIGCFIAFALLGIYSALD